jgi:glycopeptide antibiotics resistance protein
MKKEILTFLPLIFCMIAGVLIYKPSHYYNASFVVQRVDVLASYLVFTLLVLILAKGLGKLYQSGYTYYVLHSSFFVYLFFVYWCTIFPFPFLMAFGFSEQVGSFIERYNYMRQMITNQTWFNFIPFTTIYRDLANNKFQLIGNMILFSPLPFYMATMMRSSGIKTFFTVFACSLGVEIMQLITTCISFFFTNTYYRGFDIDDIMLNTFGGWILGYGLLFNITRVILLFFSTKKIRPDRKKCSWNARKYFKTLE